MVRAYSTLEIKSANDQTGEIVGFASTPQTDREGDQMVPEGAQFSLPLPLLFAHDHGQPVGTVIRADVTADGIRVVAKLALDASERIREVWSLIKAGSLRGLSVGFRALDYDPLPSGGRRFTLWDWFELSVCAVPMNAAATIANVKHFSAQPVSALRINPVSKPRKEGKKVNISSRIDSLEQVSNAALVPWLSRMKALGHGGAIDIEGVARGMGAPAELAAKIKAAVGGETTDDAPGLSGHSAAVTAFINQMRDQSVFARIFSERWAMQVPFHTRLMSIGVEANASVIGDGLPIPLQGLNWDDPLIVTPSKIAAALVLTNELWGDVSAQGQSFVNTQLRAAVSAAADSFLFGKLTTAGVFDESVLTTADFPDAGSLRGVMLGALNRVNTRAAGRLVWAASPAAANMLALMEDDTLNPFGGTIAKIPAVITGGFTGARLALVDAAAIGGNIERLEITSSEQATLEMADNPTGDGTSVVSLFQTDSSAVKYVLSLGLEPVRDDAAAFITFEEMT